MIKDFNKPDLNAPRCREKVKSHISQSFLNEFIEKYPQYKDLSYADVRKILSTFHGKLWNHAVHNRDGVELPEGLGFIFIGTCQAAKSYVVDYGTSLEYDQKIRHRNFESDNHLAKIFYTNFASKYKFKYREMWKFVGTRDFKRSVAKVYPEKWKMYVQAEANKNISRYVKQYLRSQAISKKVENLEIDDTYNEFNLD